jgi:hypothetical protein
MTDSFALDTVESIEMRCKRDEYKKTAHDGGYRD